MDRAVDDALAATGFKIVKLEPEFTDKWNQAQKDAAIVAAVGAWIYDRNSKIELGSDHSNQSGCRFGRA